MLHHDATEPPAQEVSSELLAWETLPARELVARAFTRFGSHAAIGTSFQHSGLVLIDLAKESGLTFRVFFTDTGRLHDETLRHVQAVERHFGIAVERLRPNPAEVCRMEQQHGEFLFFDSPDKRLHCCKVRKDQPTTLLLRSLRCWIVGLRRDQSDERRAARSVSLSDKGGHTVVKLSPLADWTEEQVVTWVRERGIPENPLYRRGYRSIGCAICTTPVRPGEPARAGRWRWEHAGTTKECGLHLEGGGGI